MHKAVQLRSRSGIVVSWVDIQLVPLERVCEKNSHTKVNVKGKQHTHIHKGKEKGEKHNHI